MKAILIDTEKKEVREVDCANNIKAMHQLIQCDCFCMVPMRFPYGDALYVDDEGLLTPKGRSMFKIAGYHQPLVGNGLLCGHDDEGEAKDVYMSVDAVRARVVFFT